MECLSPVVERKMTAIYRKHLSQDGRAYRCGFWVCLSGTRARSRENSTSNGNFNHFSRSSEPQHFGSQVWYSVIITPCPFRCENCIISYNNWVTAQLSLSYRLRVSFISVTGYDLGPSRSHGWISTLNHLGCIDLGPPRSYGWISFDFDPSRSYKTLIHPDHMSGYWPWPTHIVWLNIVRLWPIQIV